MSEASEAALRGARDAPLSLLGFAATYDRKFADRREMDVPAGFEAAHSFTYSHAAPTTVCGMMLAPSVSVETGKTAQTAVWAFCVAKNGGARALRDAALQSEALRLEALDDGLAASNRGGFHSDRDVLRCDVPDARDDAADATTDDDSQDTQEDDSSDGDSPEDEFPDDSPEDEFPDDSPDDSSDDERGGDSRGADAGGLHAPPRLSRRRTVSLSQEEVPQSILELRTLISAAAQALPPFPAGSKLLKRRVVHSWFNVNRGDSHHNALHDHRPAAFSGVYYPGGAHDGDGVPDGESGSLAADGGAADGESGSLAFMLDSTQGCSLAAPEAGAVAKGHCAYGVVRPRTGLLLFFPGGLKHAVLPMAPGTPQGNARISLSFNVVADVS
ncbi:hypothetical protein M885DRAFT_615261 [Pelagophyceae sp. CCMP2097]|nr:hypothetical protein M885DRAFT_615261 [Pelagophyceae sp. CCMP2097]